MGILAKSHSFIVDSEYEAVRLIHAEGRRTVIGDFYGDPKCALIDREEKWCVVAGEGIVVYWLREPFDDYRRGQSSRQYQEFLRESEGSVFIDTLTQIRSDSVLVEAENGETYNISLDAIGYAAIQRQR